MEIHLTPIGRVRNSRTTPTDDFWETIIADIELADHVPTEALDHISAFSHLEIIYFFDKVKSEDIIYSGRPRGNPLLPQSGHIRAAKKRPAQYGRTLHGGITGT